MPTSRRRHALTETDEVARVLDEAARKWQDVPRSKLIQRVLADWAAGGRSPAARAAARRGLVGSLPGSSALYDRADEWRE